MGKALNPASYFGKFFFKLVPLIRSLPIRSNEHDIIAILQVVGLAPKNIRSKCLPVKVGNEHPYGRHCTRNRFVEFLLISKTIRCKIQFLHIFPVNE